MERGYSHNISIILDSRRSKANGKFPVKLRVYSKTLSKSKLYSIDVDLTVDEFENIWLKNDSLNVRGKNRQVRARLQKFELRANEEAEKLIKFSFEKFERNFFRKSTDGNNVIYHFQEVIKENIRKGKIGTSESFKYALKSIIEFNKVHCGKEITVLTFDSIDKNWLEAYEEHMVSKGKSITTVGFYLRSLRIIFNNAIDSKDIDDELYPFGKKRYQIPRSNKVKKALTNNELKILFNSKPKTKEQEKAKDFWFFSYVCNGMNLKDVLLLKHADIKNDKFSYYRAKTFSKSKIKEKIEIYLNDYSKKIIEKYGDNKSKGFVFQTLRDNDSENIRYKKTKNFTRFINQHIKILAKDNGLPNEISSYWARHSFATNSIRKGASMEFVSEALNHSDLTVTKNYFAGFEDETKKEFAKQLMDF